ncbi:perlucin-like [Sitodiplosis mosellana]|uniref:perlucin-like n=1 Tax=Sitodiplosis mosellana TaxID=263140 RepID=UPI002443A3FF|nr:perlucin-like [Sitodiplosis mosellana]
MYCAASNMELATISSKEEDDALVAYMKRNGYEKEPLWVFGTDLGHEKRNEAPNAAHFSWMSTGKPLGYSNWLPNEPNHSGAKMEHCLEINFLQGKWNDNECNTGSRYFVCQFQKS